MILKKRKKDYQNTNKEEKKNNVSQLTVKCVLKIIILHDIIFAINSNKV